MARFFFDVVEDEALYADTEGTELADARVAEVEAVQTLAEIARDALPGTVSKHLVMQVRDAKGDRLFELDLTFTFERGRYSN